MTSAENSERNVNNLEISTKDLQLLLQQKLGKQVMVLKSRTSALLPPGENFACSIFKIQATIKQDQNSPEKTIHLVAKMFPAEDFLRNVFDFTFLFKKEIFFYEKFLPALQQLEIDFGVKPDEIFNLAPKLYGSRRSADLNVNIVDDTTVILLQNLRIKGYYSPDKIEGLDLHHSRMAIKTLAKFHALGIACKEHRREFFETEVVAHAKVARYRNSTDEIFNVMLTKLLEDPRMAAYREPIDLLLGPKMRSMYFSDACEEPWRSVAHLDIWTNNVLYRKDAEGNLDDIKMIDFQNYACNSPLRDLPYFLCTSTSRDVLFNKLDELLDLYYQTYVEVLKQMGCDSAPFSRSSFDAQLKYDSGFEFFHSIIAIKFFYAQIDPETYDSSQVESVIINSQLTPSGYDKWHDIVSIYDKQGWLIDLSHLSSSGQDNQINCD